jgi:hypothetical protein
MMPTPVFFSPCDGRDENAHLVGREGRRRLVENNDARNQFQPWIFRRGFIEHLQKAFVAIIARGRSDETNEVDHVALDFPVGGLELVDDVLRTLAAQRDVVGLEEVDLTRPARGAAVELKTGIPFLLAC